MFVNTKPVVSFVCMASLALLSLAPLAAQVTYQATYSTETDHHPTIPLVVLMDVTFSVPSTGVLQVVLANNTVNQNVEISSENLTQLWFTLSGVTTGSLTGVSGQLLTSLPGNFVPSPTPFGPIANTPWTLTTGSTPPNTTGSPKGKGSPANGATNFLLTVIRFSDSPYGIIGPPGPAGTYTNTANPYGGSSYDKLVSTELPLFYRSATFTLSIPGITASTLSSLSNIVFALGPDGPDNDDISPLAIVQPSGPLTLACPSNMSATVGVPYSSAFAVTGGTPSYTFSITASGTLPYPAGLTLNSSTGALSWTPTMAGTFSFIGSVTDSSSPAVKASTPSCSITVAAAPPAASCLAASISTAVTPAADFAAIGLQGSQFQIQKGVQLNGALGIGASGQLHLSGGVSVTSTLYADPTATIKIDGGSSLTGPTLTQPMSALQTAAINLSNADAALTPTQTFSQITSSLTITGNFGRNVIGVSGNFHLSKGDNLTISGSASDSFIVNAPGGMQLDPGSNIILVGVKPTQVLFNFPGNGGQIQVNNANTAGIFLAPSKQIQINGGIGNSEFISGAQLQFQGNAQVTAPSCVTVPIMTSSCKATSSLSALVQPPNVTAYVPNGSWSQTSTGVQVVPLEGGGNRATIATPNVVNSCASNSTTGETVCTANNLDVYLITGTTLNTKLTSGAAASYSTSFSGGSCQTCGVTVNPATNTAAIEVSDAASASGSGLQILNLTTNTFSAVVPSYNQISEDVVWDPTRNLILSPGETGFYDIFDTSVTPPMEYQNTQYMGTAQFDSAGEECSTGIALATDEGTSNLFITDLTQATFTPGSPIGSWTAPSTLFPIPEFVPYNTTEEGTNGIAIAQGTHLGIVAGEYPHPSATTTANAIVAIQLPSTAGSPTPALQDYVVANLPADPSGQVFSMGCDPHTVTAYVSPNTGKAIGLVTDYAPACASSAAAVPTYVALIDLQALLNAPRAGGTHTAVSPLPAGVVTFVPVH